MKSYRVATVSNGNPMKLTLFIKRRGELGTCTSQVLSIDKLPCILGRKEADCVINSPTCSRQHAAIFLSSRGELRIRDLNSTNGTFIRDQRIRQASLRPGDEFRMSDCSVIVLDYQADLGMESGRETPPPLPRAERTQTGATSILVDGKYKRLDEGTTTAPQITNSWPDNFGAMPREAGVSFRSFKSSRK